MARVVKLLRNHPRVEVRVDDERMNFSLGKLAANISDLRRFWTEYFAPQFYEDIQKNFAAEGRYVGGWRALSPAYAAWKLRHFGRKPILQRTGLMKESLQIGGRFNVLRSMKTRVIFGSTVPYLPFHQRGTPRMPRRRVLWIGPNRVYERLLVRWLTAEGNRAGVRLRARSA